MKGKFFLLKPNGKEATKVIYVFHIASQKVNFRYTTDQFIEQKNWNKEHGLPNRVRASSKLFNQLEIIREELLIYSAYMESLLKKGVHLDRAVLKNEFDKHFKNRMDINIHNVHEVFEGFIQYRLTMPKKDKKIKKGTISRYNSFGNLLKDYKPLLRFEDFNDGFRDQFKIYCLSRMSSKSFNRQLGRLTSFLDYCYDREYLKSDAFKMYKTIAVDDNVDKVILTKEQIQELYDLDLSMDKNLSDARDLFIIGCYSGLRISDFTRITKEHLREGGRVIRINHVKTGKLSQIPMKPLLLSTLEKHDYKLPKMYDHKINALIKIVCKRAGFVEQQTWEQDGKMVTKKLYERVTSHCAKRSYITILNNEGVPVPTIAKITATSVKTLTDEYITITESEIAKIADL